MDDSKFQEGAQSDFPEVPGETERSHEPQLPGQRQRARRLSTGEIEKPLNRSGDARIPSPIRTDRADDDWGFSPGKKKGEVQNVRALRGGYDE